MRPTEPQWRRVDKWIGAAYKKSARPFETCTWGDPQIRDWYVTDRRTEENVIRLYMLLVPRKPRRVVLVQVPAARHSARDFSCVVTPLDDQAAHARLRHVPPPRLSTCAAALGANGSRAERADQFAAPQRHSLKHDWRWWCCSSCCRGVWPTQQARCTAATAQRSDASRIR